jgi:hypothetical protein
VSNPLDNATNDFVSVSSSLRAWHDPCVMRRA